MIEKAIEKLEKDELIVYPTETVYGLGGDAFSTEAVKKVFKTKDRPRNEPISIAISDWSMIKKVADIDRVEENIMRNTLPGPITYIVKRKQVESLKILAAGKDKIGIRFPSHPVALGLISRFGKPITSTSANKTGEPAPKFFSEIKLDLNWKIFGGKPFYDKPSTVFDLTQDELIRRGPIPISSIKKATWN
ncbi:threonylcarbamoyl-AMP synthase [archaeon SCG-AAA382B04]|nr:threonylcarbamoyl-AMP synthase [archaeon SCG-AAA382B04]